MAKSNKRKRSKQKMEVKPETHEGEEEQAENVTSSSTTTSTTTHEPLSKQGKSQTDTSSKDKRKGKKRKKPSTSHQDSSTSTSTAAVADADAQIDDDADKETKPRKPTSEGKSDTDTKSSKSTSTPAPNSFESIRPPLSPGILSAIQHYGFTQMTPVQSAVLPLFLTHKDVCVQAVTGSGKTLAFLIPMVEMILRRTTLLTTQQVGGLVISPTRELARQTHEICTTLCKYCSLPPPLLLVGGSSGHRPVQKDLEAFARDKSDIVIGTPGRIEDIISRYSDLHLHELECLVLDEADVLLNMGFEVTLTNILSKLPRMRRTGLFSATSAVGSGKGTSGATKRLMARAGMRNPVMINVAIARSEAEEAKAGPETDGDIDGDGNGNGNEKVEKDGDVKMASTSTCEETKGSKASSSSSSSSKVALHEQATPTTLTNYYHITSLPQKTEHLLSFLQSHSDRKIVIFFLTCACVEFYGLVLPQLLDVPVEILHGKLSPKRREKAMERFRATCEDLDESGGESSGVASGKAKGKGAILLCTDIAARGLDIPHIEWTVQYDAPSDPTQYVHRVGRSARAGRFGSSLIFLSPKEESFVDFLQIRKVPLQQLTSKELVRVDGGSDLGEVKNVLEQAEEKVEKMDGKEEAIDETIEKDGGDDSDKNRSTNATGQGNHGGGSKVLNRIKRIVMKDRDVLEKGTKAYTSYIRAYKEHKCSFIFRFASLDLGALATSFCLLRLPKIPELHDKKKINFTPVGPEVDIHAIQFKDKVREKARQKRLAAELAAGGKNAKQIKAERRLAEKLKRQKEHRAAEIEKGRNPNKRKGKQARIFDEWDDLAKEERLYKKLKKGKITKEKYDELMYGDRPSAEDALLHELGL